MRSLGDIFGFPNLSHREILFEDGKWCIYRRTDMPHLLNSIYVIHRCVKVEKALNHGVWHCGNRQGHGCGKVAPKGIQALYILLRWDEK